MAKVCNPTLFSQYFKFSPALLTQAGLIDPLVDVDTQLFIDPILLQKSTNSTIAQEALAAFRQHFQNLVRLLKISKAEGDAAWKGARRLLDLSEPPENGLGYGGSGRSGSSRPDELRETILRTCKEIITLGAEDPEMISLMGLFEENVGADTISDLTTRVIVQQLAEITNAFCAQHAIPMRKNSISSLDLPTFDHLGRDRPMVLVPSDIVRDLPVANDWSDVQEAASQNDELRQRINAYLAGIMKPTVADKKDALRHTALSSADIFKLFLATIKENTENYDPNEDALGYFKFKGILAEGIEGLKAPKSYALTKGPEEVESLVIDTLNLFKHHVENGNLWEELYIGGKPKKERAAQLIYYAIADCFCKVNNVDISPEANMGGGPIDFKFSSGYKARVLVEIKRSSGTVVHGYDKQLEIYKDASRTQFGIFVIIDYGDMGTKLRKIRAIQKKRLDAGQKASRIMVIDARKKTSASKRK